jgi:hypothetical protein
MEVFCSPVAGGLSILTIALIVFGFLWFVELLEGWFLAKVLKKRGNIPDTPEY